MLSFLMKGCKKNSVLISILYKVKLIYLSYPLFYKLILILIIKDG
jgi:hypothetical protein